MKEKLKFYIRRIKEGRIQEMWRQTKWIYGYARNHWLAMIVYTLLGMVGTVVSLFSSFISRDLVDIITGHQAGALISTFAMMIGFGIGSMLLNQVTSYVTSWISMKVNAEVKADIYEKILVTDWESLTNYHTGDLLARWGSDASTISSGVLSFIPSAIINIFRFISAFAVVMYNDYTFIIFAFLGMPVSLILSKTLMRRMVNNNKRSAAMNAKMSGFNQESFANIQIIKAFDLIRLYAARLQQLQKEFISMSLEFQRMSIWTSMLLSTVGLIVSYASYGWGVYRVWSGAITYGSMTMFIGLSGQLTGTLHGLTALVPTAINLTTSAGRLMDIVEMPREDYSQESEIAEFAERHTEDGVSLKLTDIAYTYKTGTEVFKHASFEAHPHEIIGLVGPSGEGKTTMMRVLLSLILPQEGEAVFIGGSEEVALSPATRRLISYVPQGNTMMSGTIAENMRNVKSDATDEEIVEALKLACAWDFVNKLPDGIYSEIKERGGGFSEGQAQRLSIARALLRKSPVLLLDEATSALDVATERKVLRSIMADTNYPRTCIVTTHRPTVLTMCNRVYAIREKKCTVLDESGVQQLVNDF
ncbi:MAG: ABC transporter ATP-binding protein [Oscillospiraceae bacterium]|nr:ABC transporter ATP-binding protein [Oscillospiraceae bacterium]